MASALNMVFFLVGLLSATLCLMACLWWSFPKQPFRSYMEIFFWGVPLGLFCATNGFIAVVSLHISTYHISKYHTISTIITQYIFSSMQWFLAGRGKRQMEGFWREPQKEQDRLLKAHMKNDLHTEYGKAHRFGDIKSMEDFRKRLPLTRYENYREYLEKIAKGATLVLTKETLKRFGVTSGTTGQSKIVPMMPSRASIALTSGMALNSVVSSNFRKFSPLQKWMTTYTAPRPLWTNTGILVGPMNMYTEQQKRFIGIYNSPLAAFCVLNDFASTYLHLLYSIRDPSVAVWITSFTSQVKKTMRLLEAHWTSLLDDLTTGTLNKDLAIPPEVRADLDSSLYPERARAAELKKEFEQGFEGIILRIWPQLSHIVAVDVEDLKEELQQTYAKDVPIYSAAYTATEAELGLNLWPDRDEANYVLLPNSAIFEFIPEEKIMEEQPKTLVLNELEKEKCYEIVITQNGGLCRYRLGDVVKVVNFHLNTPVVQFQYRTEQVLNLSNEHVTEVDMKTSLKQTINQWNNVKLENWAYAESTLLAEDLKPPEEPEDKGPKEAEKDNGDKGPKEPKENEDKETKEPKKEIKQTRDIIGRDSSEKFYMIFVELRGKETEISEKRVQDLDAGLQNQCEQYRACRESQTLASPHVIAVKPGTFQHMETYIVAHTAASHNQYKIPRKIYNAHLLRFLVEGDVCSKRKISV